MSGKLSSLPGEKRGSNTESNKVALETYTWYKPDMTREKVMDYLLRRPVGSFVVRESTSHKSSYSLSMRVQKSDNPTGVSHYLLEKTADGVKFKGLEQEWSNLAALVVHHSVAPELLPCTLLLPDKMVKGATEE
ncbi:EGFR adapter protein-like [Watersipora subatra]|uniref:EGFR adapter protein-like n=1 Tax=Watersipora subatra TaxID=2589382 RepID=UPI00355B8705